MKAADLVGQGERSHEQIWKCRNQTFVNCDGSLRRAGGTRRGRGNGRGNYGGREERCGRCGSSGRSPERSWERRGGRFSANFQWLPCEVELRPVSSKSGSSIRAASYINNLHPRHHASLYDSIEKCIELSIETWNEVLVYWGRGRTPERIRTCGVQWTSLPESLACLKNRTTTVGSAQDPPSSETEKLLDQFLLQPDNPRVPAPSRRYPAVGRDWRDHFSPAKAIEAKYHRVKEWFHPEPGTTFTYEEWARGENNRAILPECGPELPEVVDRSSRRNRPFYTVSIENDFADQGLQVVVEIGEVELTPAEPSRSSTDWQLTGLANDHIVATTVIYFSSENVTPESGSISFRVEAQLDPQMHIYGTGTGSNPFHPLEPLADVYGCASHLDLTGEDAENAPGGPALQVLGTVAAPDGRLITFPNVMQHRIEAFQLVDLSRSGRRKWLKLHLVDPHYRVCSTRNVPPQQHDWWYEAGLGKLDWAAREMPAELVQEIESLVGEFPTTNKLANEVRGDILEERKRKFEIVSRNVPPYNFGDWAAYGSTAGEDAR
ncbi:hypothetical protein TI39_contig278g00069 [Zymoseptoria brevis]|uniref:DUF4246 domain-containing protein n=1 Tax=Zymoseptoria brevis TaxID=1047168 RepID=A0A0F4GX25_9PEZI|nr:hypothetical protein TI39_contig278g00069 [Zymoseptoria brevis]